MFNHNVSGYYFKPGNANYKGKLPKKGWRLTKATKKAGIRLQGGNSTLSDKELIKAYKKAYQDPELHGIRGDLRTPNGKIVIATNVSPSKAIKLLVEWARTQE